MRINVSTAFSCAREAVQDFRLHEYLPFGVILASQFLFLILAVNLGAPWGMATVGWLARNIGGDVVSHYPTFFLFLPNLAAWVEAFLYTVPGCVLIPLAVARILEPTDPALQASGAILARVKRSILPALVGGLLTVGILAGWQYLLPLGLGPLVRSVAGGGIPGQSAYWLLGILVAYAISVCFLCVPIVAVKDDRGFAHSLIDGIKRSLAVFPFSCAFVVAFSSPAILVLYVTQVFGRQLVIQMRPEITAVLLCAYVIFINIGTYLLYAATTRLLILDGQEGA
jgi:uncharacterized membrane protein